MFLIILGTVAHVININNHYSIKKKVCNKEDDSVFLPTIYFELTLSKKILFERLLQIERRELNLLSLQVTLLGVIMYKCNSSINIIIMKMHKCMWLILLLLEKLGI